MRTAGEALLDKAERKFANALKSGVKSTAKRAQQYWSRGAETIIKYSARAGTNSGVGSVIGTVANAATIKAKLTFKERRLAM